MKRILIFVLVMVLMLASVSPALAGNGGNGGGGGSGNGGQGGNGNANGQQSQNNVRNQNRNTDRKATFTVLTGVVTDIQGTMIFVEVYGGKDTSLYGTIVDVPTDASTRFVLKDVGPITFADVAIGDPVSVAIGSDGIADRVTVGAEIACLPD